MHKEVGFMRNEQQLGVSFSFLSNFCFAIALILFSFHMKIKKFKAENELKRGLELIWVQLSSSEKSIVYTKTTSDGMMRRIRNDTRKMKQQKRMVESSFKLKVETENARKSWNWFYFCI